MKEIIEKVRKLVEREYERALSEHGLNSSMHEGYAVLKEEVEEAETEMGLVSGYTEIIWSNVKSNDKEEARGTSKVAEERAILTAAECIQVAAMCRKFRGEPTGGNMGDYDPAWDFDRKFNSDLYKKENDKLDNVKEQ